MADVAVAPTPAVGRVPEPKQNEYHYFKRLNKSNSMELTCCYLLVNFKSGGQQPCGHKYICSDSCMTKPRQELRKHLAECHGVLLG